MPTFDDVFGAAESLAPMDRIRLVQALWDTIPVEQWPAPSAEWVSEAARRSAEIDAGRMSASPWPEVRERARRKAGLDG
jgi:putative addiction module component (TIGR02574 family)